jgi:class 3 adenylate cyclase
LIVILLLICVGCIAPALAAVAPIIHLTDEARYYDVIPYADVLNDPSGNLDVDDVARSREFRPAGSAAHAPIGIVLWYRFGADTPRASVGHWYLKTSFNCDDADLFERRADGSFLHRAFGFHAPYASHPAPGNRPGLLVPSLQATMYARLRCPQDEPALLFVSYSTLQISTAYNWAVHTATVAISTLAIVALGLAFVTRSRLYALVTCNALAGAINVSLPWIGKAFPGVALPSFLWLVELTGNLVALSALFFYESFFARYGLSRRARLALRAGTALSVLVYLTQYILLPPSLYEALPLLAPGAQTGVFIFGLWYVGVAVLAARYARAGNRPAWFVAAGALGFGISLYVADAGYFWPDAPVWLGATWAFAFAFDAAMFILGVGDQLRETARAQRLALQQRDDTQSLLLAEQHAHIADIETRNRAFARFVPREFLGQLDKGDLIDVALGDHTERSMAVLFTDLRGFTTMSERLSSEATFDVLNGYFARAGPVIRAHGGFIDKYVGDAIVALFPNRPSDALDAAIGVQSEVRRFNEERSRRGEEPIAVGIGVNYGSMLLGTVGESERFETTVIADSVNVASRLEGLTKVFGVGIIVGGALVDALENRDAYSVRPLGEVEIRGHQRRATAYELFDGDPHELVLLKRRLLDDFTAALAAYAAGDFVASAARFDAIVRAAPADTAALHFRDRSAAMRDEGIIPGAPNTFA